jgi:hypothetical protein
LDKSKAILLFLLILKFIGPDEANITGEKPAEAKEGEPRMRAPKA